MKYLNSLQNHISKEVSVLGHKHAQADITDLVSGAPINNPIFTGNVGIGLTPTQKLDVNGIVNATGFMVNGVAFTGGSGDGIEPALKLIFYSYNMNSTLTSQTDFEIPLDTFIVNADTCMVYLNSRLVPTTDYYISQILSQRGHVIFNSGVNDVGSLISLFILKNVPTEIGEPSTSNLASYNYNISTTVTNQMDIEIPLDSFLINVDICIVHLNSRLVPSSDYSITQELGLHGHVIFNSDISDIGNLVSLLILKNILPEVNGAGITANTIPPNRIMAGTLTNKLVAQSNALYTTAQIRNTILSTGDAVLEDMNNGDIWIKYT